MADQLITLDGKQYWVNQVFIYYDRPAGLPAKSCADQQSDFCASDIDGDGFITFDEYDGGRDEFSMFQGYVINYVMKHNNAKVYIGRSLDEAKRKRNFELRGNSLELLSHLRQFEQSQIGHHSLLFVALGTLLMGGAGFAKSGGTLSSTGRGLAVFLGATVLLEGFRTVQKGTQEFDTQFPGVAEKIS